MLSTVIFSSRKNVVISNKIKKVSGFWNIFLNGVFIIYGLLCIIPLVLVISVSLSDEKAITLYGYKLIPKVFSTYAYEYLFKNASAIFRSYGLTVGVTVVGTILSVIIIALYAYPLSRKSFKYRNAFSFFIFFTMIFNGGLVPWYIVCTQLLHLKDNILAYIFPSLVSAWYILIMRTFFVTNIQDSIIESARIDGAGEFRTFLQIVIPLSKAGLATIALFQTLQFWNEWFLPLMFIENDHLFNLQYILYRVLVAIQYLTTTSNPGGNNGAILARMPSETARMAMCVLAIGPIIIAYPFFQKNFVKGLTVGAVKG